ncbi:MAG: hypothetical protein BRD26_04420 [Bacteroidetes bacterium QH_1_64_81]|nr:MAG: hypothetical protein BRD26_04420 [Bacteroidetes bacterium QH_1_64_81]
MSLYDLHDATLNDMEGEGFAYSEKTVYGKAYKGVFFGEDSVEVTDVVSTPSGERADFVATEKP